MEDLGVDVGKSVRLLYEGVFQTWDVHAGLSA